MKELCESFCASQKVGKTLVTECMTYLDIIKILFSYMS